LKKAKPSCGSTDTGSIVSMSQDILVLLLPHLATQDASELFDTILSKDVLISPDNGVQKRGYKILARLIEGGKLSLDAEPLIKRLDELSDGLSPAAKKVNSMTSMKPGT
jgi:ribosomal RNA-processing protein 12